MIESIFPCPVYIARSFRQFTYDEEIRNIVDGGMQFNGSNSTSSDSYIFDTKLKEIKQFCEDQIKIYVEQVICPVERDLDFYITQSWLNVNRPGEVHYEHCHANSIISGVFYISAEEDDNITFVDPNYPVKDRIQFETKVYNIWNSEQWSFQSNSNELILFPSWLNHKVDANPNATKDRLSISFNTFVRGTIGEKTGKYELILK